MADNDQGQSSPIFTKLPAEMRLKIYEGVFEGSKTTYKQRLVVGDRTYRNILLPTSHRNFLLTCRQAYNEAQEAYWRNTILFGDIDDEELVFFLRSVVPSPAKLHVKHIRCLCHLGLLLKPWSPVRGCLEEFQNLQTVGIVGTATRNMQDWVGTAMAPTIHMAPTIEEHLEEYLNDEAPYFNQLIYDSGPAVIYRLLFRRALFGGRLPDEELFEDDCKMEDLNTANIFASQQMCFYNYNTRKIFYADDPDHIQDEEACFAMVLDN